MPYVIVMLLVLMAGMGYSAKEYYDYSQEQMHILKSNNEKLELVIEEKDAEMERIQANMKVQQEALNDMTLRTQEIQAEMNRYLDIFKRHNLTKLAAAKPGLIESRVNKGTKNVFDSIESDSAIVDSLDN